MGTVVAGRWQFGVLGPLEASCGGEPARLGGERQRVLLALLLAHGNELMTPDQLVELLFGERRRDAAVNAVQVAVSRLRRVLAAGDRGDGVLHSRPGGYLLRLEPGQLDAAVFERLLGEGRGLLTAGQTAGAAERLRQALALWRGAALADLAAVECLQGEIRRLEELRLVAVMERVDADLALGAGAELVSELESLVASEPLQERLRGQLMLALYRAGRQADALAVYRDLSGVLRDELGLEPSTSLQDLERSILQHDASLHPPPTEGLGPPLLAAMPDRGYGSTGSASGLFEREGELAAIGGLVEAALAGSGRLLVVDGAAGVGKTRLLEEASRAAGAAGMDVVRARGVALEDQFAFGVVRQLFEGVLAGASAAERGELLSGAAGLAGGLLGVAAPDELRPAGDVSFAMLHGLYWLCFNLAARKPLFVVVDDAHWADGPSLRFVSFLAARLEGLQVVLALALRSGEHGVAVGVLETIRNDAGARVLQPAQLSERACERLITETFGRAPAREFSRACCEVTGGNPFYLRALVDGLRAEGIPPDAKSAEAIRGQVPESVVRSLVLRLSRLPAAASALARAVAVLGTDAEQRHAAELAGLELREAAKAADLLAGTGLLAPGRPLRFVHPLVEAAIYAELPSGERDLMHREAARMLAASGLGSERAAAHLLVSGPTGDPWSVEMLRAAAADAWARGAPDSAVSYLQRARQEGGLNDGVAAEVLWELGAAQARCAQPAAVEPLEKALAMAGDSRQRSMIADDLAGALGLANRFEDAVSVLETALNDLGDTNRTLRQPPGRQPRDGPWPARRLGHGSRLEQRQSLEASLLGFAALQLSTRPAHRRHLARVREQTLGDSHTERMLLAQVACWSCSEGQRADVVRALAERALADGRLLAEVGTQSSTFFCVLTALLFSDSLELAHSWLDQAMADARARGSAWSFAWASSLRAALSYRVGELAEAEADARTALAAVGGEQELFGPQVLATLTQVLIERGQLREAAALLNQCEIRFGLDQPLTATYLPYAHGNLAAATGKWRAAADSFLRLGEWNLAWGEHNPGTLDWRTGAALALAQLGEAERARELSGEVVELSRYLGQPRCLGIGLRAAGIIVGGAQGIDLLRQAIATLENTPAKLEHARALVDLGAALRRLNHRKEAREPLRHGTDLAQRCGATALTERGQAELVATGARPRRVARSGVAALTPSERRVARLAAGGRSSPEIAQELFVTVNTVETHLRHAYIKLDIHSREQLRGILRAAEPANI
jgi:DNA-binding SARP family transcriptional activator/DNA-binding CsgD family transcriptional regulator